MFFTCKRCGKPYEAEAPEQRKHSVDEILAAKSSWLLKEVKLTHGRSDEKFIEAVERSFDAYARMFTNDVPRFPSTMTTVYKRDVGYEVVCKEC